MPGGRCHEPTAPGTACRHHDHRPGFVTFHKDASVAMGDLALTRQFLLESQSRAIDSCDDIAELRRLAKTLLNAWSLQSDMTRHYGAQALGIQRHP